METVLYIAILMIGYIAGAVSAGYILRNTRGPGLAESEAEFAGLKARLAERDKLLAECRVSLEAAHGEQTRLQDELKAECERRAVVEEKAGRVPGLEELMSVKDQAIAILNVEISELKARHASLMTRMDDAVKGGEEKAHFLDEIQKRMNEALSRVAAEAVAQAQQVAQPVAEGERLVLPNFEESLKPVQEALARMEQERASAHAALAEQVRVLAESQARPQAEVSIQPLQESLAKLEQERANELTALTEQVRALAESQAKPQVEVSMQPLQESLARLEVERTSQLTALSEQIRALAEAHAQSKNGADPEAGRRQLEEAVKPLRESLERFEQERTTSFGALTEQVRALADTQSRLHAETAHLTRALKIPAGRGRWGEVQLQRVVELAGLSEHCDFSPSGEVSDLMIHLPSQREIVVNAKVPLTSYFEALEAPTDDERNERLKAHAAAVRAHLEALSMMLPPEAEFAVAFMPGETFLSAAVEQDPALLEDGVKSKVLLATPTSLIALLKAVSFGWSQERLARNAQDISELGRVLYDRLEVLTSHFDEMRRSIESSVDAYNRAAGVLEGQVLTGARRFKELGATTSEEFAGPEAVEVLPRALMAAHEPVLAGAAESSGD